MLKGIHVSKQRMHTVFIPFTKYTILFTLLSLHDFRKQYYFRFLHLQIYDLRVLLYILVANVTV